MTTEEKQKKLDELAKMAGLLDFELARTSRLVFGEGSPDAEVVFIGEAPGALEDETGQPFVGLSGKLLRKNIQAIGWSEEDVYITSVVKHHPPQNRDPFPSEIEINRQILDEQIVVIDPILIVTPGRFSMAKFLPNVKISQVHGRLFKVPFGGKTFFIFPSYHPAAALRSTKMKEAFEKDFKKLPEVLEEIRRLPTPASS